MMAEDKKALTKEQILGASDIEIEKVDVSEWGGFVYVKGMTAKQRDDFEASILRQHGKVQRVDMSDLRAKLASKSICNADGELLFSEKDIKVLSDKSAGALQRVFEVAQRLSGLSDEDAEDLLKN
jgi:hypothetical protein